jgi:hypothetical protein
MKCAECHKYCDGHHFVIGGRELCPRCAVSTLRTDRDDWKHLAESRDKYITQTRNARAIEVVKRYAGSTCEECAGLVEDTLAALQPEPAGSGT